jgi:hypothetical protein
MTFPYVTARYFDRYIPRNAKFIITPNIGKFSRRAASRRRGEIFFRNNSERFKVACRDFRAHHIFGRLDRCGLVSVVLFRELLLQSGDALFGPYCGFKRC